MALEKGGRASPAFSNASSTGIMAKPQALRVCVCMCVSRASFTRCREVRGLSADSAIVTPCQGQTESLGENHSTEARQSNTRLRGWGGPEPAPGDAGGGVGIPEKLAPKGGLSKRF